MKRTILIIDDDDAVVVALTDVLADEGYRVVSARDGRWALDYLELNPPPSLILLDLMMPRMNGHEFRKEQLANPALRGIPTIVLTAGGIDERLEDLDTTGWLRKPVDLETLLTAIERLSGKHDADLRRITPPTEHLVQLYETDAALAESVGQYLCQGLEQGDAALVVATRPHAAAFEHQLAARGFDVAALRGSGRLYTLDAAEALASLMVREAPHEGRFRDRVVPLLSRVASAAATGSVRVYGEMVDLLWRQGNLGAAIRLEELWNQLAQDPPFSLYCAYHLQGRPARALDSVRALHSHVIAYTA